MPSLVVPLSNSIYLHHCTMFDPISIIFKFHDNSMTKSSLSILLNYQINCIQQHYYLQEEIETFLFHKAFQLPTPCSLDYHSFISCTLSVQSWSARAISSIVCYYCYFIIVTKPTIKAPKTLIPNNNNNTLSQY